MFKGAALLSVILFSLNLSAATRDFERSEEIDRNNPLNELIGDLLAQNDVEATLQLCGRLHFATIFINQNQKSDFDSAASSLQGDIYLKYLDKCDGYGYGFEMDVKADSGIVKRGNSSLKTSCVFLESDKMGALKLGYVNTAADLFSICGDRFLVGYGGAGSGNLGIFYNKSAGSVVDTGFLQDDFRAAKIVWISPIVSGISAGLSFTPNSRYSLGKQRRNPSDRSNFPDSNAVYSQNVVTGGMAYEFGAPDDLNAKISVAVWLGKGKPEAGTDFVHNVRAYNVGATLCYKKFRTSIGYADNGKSLLPRRLATQDMGAFDDSRNYRPTDSDVGLQSGADAGKIYSLGLAYSLGKLDISAGYFNYVAKFSQREKSRAHMISLAAEYEFDKTLRIYLEYDHISTDSCARARAYEKARGQSSTGKNRANLIIIGSKINF